MPREKLKKDISKKRRPSEYNRFVKKQMDAGKTMSQAADAWKKQKTILNEEKSANTKIKESRPIEKALIQNLIELQKIHTDLALKFDKLSKEISSILALFEMTARSFAKSMPVGEIEKDKDFLEKIDKLLEQNKTLAKGLMLMEDRLKERVYGGPPHRSLEQEDSGAMIPGKRPLPRF